MNQLAEACKAAVRSLDELPESPDRARHKLNMIRGAERIHASITPHYAGSFTDAMRDELISDVESACSFIDRH